MIAYVTATAAATAVADEILAMGRRVAIVKADVTEREDVDEMMKFVRREFGRIDVIVSNAATGGFRPLLATTDRNFEAAMNTNVCALIYLVQSSVTCWPITSKEPR